MRERMTDKERSDLADALIALGAAEQSLWRAACYLCMTAIAAMLYWSPAIIEHTAFLR